MKMIIRNEEELKSFLAKIEKAYNKNKTWICEFKKKPKKRSLSQSAQYWVWIDFICKECGYLRSDQKKVSDILKRKLGYWGYKTILNEKIIVVKSTAEMTKEEMCKYMNELQIYMAVEHSITLLGGEDKYFEDFYNAVYDK